MPSLAPDWISIWLFTPMTSPCRIRSGPPELPVDGGVRLDRAGDRIRVVGADRAVECADDPARHAPLEAVRAADRDDAVPDLHLRRIGERERVQLARRRVDLEHGQIGRGVVTDDRGLVLR